MLGKAQMNMKGKTMSKTKTLLADDYTTPYDTLEPDTLVTEPDEATWAVVELDNAITRLERTFAYNHLDALKLSSKRLNKVVKQLKTPF
jgi:hypothetical protein